MRKVRGLCMPLLVGLLLMSTVVGLAGARPNARPLEQSWRVLAVGAHDCIPTETCDWEHWGSRLWCNSGLCDFTCPVHFPAAGEQAVGAVNVKRFTMYVYDNDGTPFVDTFADLRKLYPVAGADVLMAGVQTIGGLATNPQTRVRTTILNNPVYRVQSPYILLEMTGSASIYVYGFFVHYTW